MDVDLGKLNMQKHLSHIFAVALYSYVQLIAVIYSCVQLYEVKSS